MDSPKRYKHKQPRKAFHGPADLFEALEKYIADTKPQPTESECLRVALEQFLIDKGYWPLPPATK